MAESPRALRPIRMLLAAVAVLTSLGHALGQPAGSQPAALTLGPPYVDGSFGFSLTPPLGGSVYRQKHFVSKADLEIVQFANPEERWSLTVRVSSTTRPLSTADIVEGITANLSERFGETTIISAGPQRIAGREGVRYAASFKAEGGDWLRLQAVIRTRPMEYFALVLATPLAAKETVMPLFDRIVASFQILRSEADEKRIQEALLRGRALLRTASLGELKLASRLVKDHYLRFVLEGREAGFVEVTEQARPQGKRSIIDIREWAWLFKPDGSIVHMRHEMSLADDLSSEKWDNRVLTLLPEQTGKPRQGVYNCDSGIREHNQLLVAYMPHPNAAQLQDKVIEVEPSYAPAAWHVLLPRLVDLATPELYAFSSYNAERRGLALRTLKVVGPTRFGGSGGQTAAIKLEDSEGLIPPITETDVDSKGNILRIIAGGLEMLATTREHVEQTYASRVKAAQEVIKKLPIKEPTPAVRQRPMDPAAPHIVQPPPERR